MPNVAMLDIEALRQTKLKPYIENYQTSSRWNVAERLALRYSELIDSRREPFNALPVSAKAVDKIPVEVPIFQRKELT